MLTAFGVPLHSSSQLMLLPLDQAQAGIDGPFTFRKALHSSFAPMALTGTLLTSFGFEGMRFPMPLRSFDFSTSFGL